jgi:hypothetical protein
VRTTWEGETVRLRTLFSVLLSIVFSASGDIAGTITLSAHSSEPITNPAEDLDATLQFEVVDGDTFTLRVTNETSDPAEYDINQVLFNATFASDGETDLELTAAEHSVAGDVLTGGEWTLLESSGSLQGPTNGTHAGGFGVHDFLLYEGVGEGSPSVIGPGENVLFSFDVLTASGFPESAFTTQVSAQVPNPPYNRLTVAVAKFVNGPNEPYDSAFGSVPEPSTGLLLAGALAGLAAARRGRPLR